MSERRVIWKFHLEEPVNALDVGANAKVVHVGTMFPTDGFDDTATVWVEHDLPVEAGDPLVLLVVGTGHPVPSGCGHVGSVCLPSSGLVWHIYHAAEAAS